MGRKTGRGLLEEIRDWPLEAKDDNAADYFFETSQYSKIADGKSIFVVGRKGTGKTAIAERLSTRSSHDVFSRKLSFKNFPFNVLYELSDSKFRSPNRFITVWKYVILLNLCSMMHENQAINVTARDELDRAFDLKLSEALDRQIRRLTDRNFSISILGSGVSKTASDQTKYTLDWTDRVTLLEDFVAKNIDDSTYFVLFDELDEDYKDALIDTAGREMYFELLTSLFKAAQDLHSMFKKHNRNTVRPVVFIRDDIYDLIRDHDKTKWRDKLINLNWTPDVLKELFAYRTSKAIDPVGPLLDFQQAWLEVFDVTYTRHGQYGKHKTETFIYLLKSTYLRPRDLISYVRECASVAIVEGLSKIDNAAIKKAEDRHSDFAKSEIIDEIQSLIPEITDILGCFSEIRKPNLSIEEFRKNYERYFHEYRQKRSGLNPEQILDSLFYFNAIGNVTRGNRQIFKYNSDQKRFNHSERICVHRSLMKGLEIY